MRRRRLYAASARDNSWPRPTTLQLLISSIVWVLAWQATIVDASAHVELDPHQVVGGGTTGFTFTSYSDEGRPLTGLTATVPAELTVLSAEPTGNFSAALQRDGSGNVVGIRWSGGSSARPLRFSFRAKTVGEAARITIPVVQSFADGSTTAWDTARTTVLGSDSASQHTPLEAVAQVRDAGDRSRVKVSVTNSTGSAITSVTVSVSEALRDARMLPSDTMDIQEIRSAGGRLVAATLTGQIPPGGNLEFGLTASVTNPATLSGSVTLADGTLRAFETNRIGSSDSNLQRIGVASAALVAILVTAALSYWRVRKRRA